jgi:hypothetical protein
LASWNPITTDQLGTGSILTITDLTAQPARFYRIEVRLVTP